MSKYLSSLKRLPFLLGACVMLVGVPPADSGTVAAAPDAQQCRQALARRPDPARRGLDARSIDLLSWNIKKGRLPNWQVDLRLLADDKDLVLIQEATESMQDQFGLPAHWEFAPGYVAGDEVTGVASSSRAAPLTRCQFQAMEPWLGTPKATTVTQYALADDDQTLVVANIHMINFTFGQRAFREQLETLRQALDGHDGPLIVSGDFNTWNEARRRALRETMTELGAEPVRFATDFRTRFLGAALDHVYVAGLAVETALTHVVRSSDHNPITLRLRLP